MKTTIAALVIGIFIGMGVGPALAGAYSAEPEQDSVRALQEIAKALQSRDTTEQLKEIARNTRELRDIPRRLDSIGSTLSRCK